MFKIVKKEKKFVIHFFQVFDVYLAVFYCNSSLVFGVVLYGYICALIWDNEHGFREKATFVTFKIKHGKKAHQTFLIDEMIAM